MFFAGLDLHKRSIEICVLDENGKRIARSRTRTLDGAVTFLRGVPGPLQVCFEASCGYGHYFETFSTVAEIVRVAHPGHLRLIFHSKKKNDRVDAYKLAKLLYLHEVPCVYVPDADVRAWRELITYRGKLIQQRTRAKNGVRALLRTLGISVPKGISLWSKAGMSWLVALEFDQSFQALKRDLMVSEIETANGRLKRVETELKRYSNNNPAVTLLQSIPGIGIRTAEAVVAFMGNPERFRNAKAVGAYFGLVPCQDQSADSNRLGHITKEGSATVRHLLTEAAWQAIRHSPTVRSHYDRIVRGKEDRRKIAVIATAHYLSRAMWSMLKHNRRWQEAYSLSA